MCAERADHQPERLLAIVEMLARAPQHQRDRILG